MMSVTLEADECQVCQEKVRKTQIDLWLTPPEIGFSFRSWILKTF
jgi:hypothetical protein